MQNYIGVPAQINTRLLLLKKEIQTGCKSMYPNAMEARDHVQEDVTIELMDTITDDQAWNPFATIEDHEDVEEMVFPQLFESQ